MENYDLIIANDHAGYELKQNIVNFLKEKNLRVLDLGSYNSTSVDYPEYAKKLAEEIAAETAKLGILICASGIGMSIAANRNSAIRAARCTELASVEAAKAHNDANVLVLGAKITDRDTALAMVEKFLTTKFEGGRHARRIAQIS